MQTRPIFLFTDFTTRGPYVGQLHARIAMESPDLRVIDLMHDAPAMQPRLAAYLLPAVCRALPADAVVVAVVDPGVGGQRDALIVETERGTFVGPDNGLLARLPCIERVTLITWHPESLSASFHGRDLFAPVAANIAAGSAVAQIHRPHAVLVGSDWPDQLNHVLYIDGYGNAVFGIEPEKNRKISAVTLKGQTLPQAKTFSDVPPGTAFWYWNSLGLMEVSVNGGSAAERFSLALDDKILVD